LWGPPFGNGHHPKYHELKIFFTYYIQGLHTGSSTLHYCKLYAPKAWTPPAPLHPVITSGPFCKWDIDFVECNPPSYDGHKYIILAINYFTEWNEAMPMFNNIVTTAAHFFFNHVITQFGVLKKLVSNHQ
jgi:hypothetical protein